MGSKFVKKNLVGLEDMEINVYVKGTSEVTMGQLDEEGKPVFETRKCWGNRVVTLAELKTLLGVV